MLECDFNHGVSSCIIHPSLHIAKLWFKTFVSLQVSKVLNQSVAMYNYGKKYFNPHQNLQNNQSYQNQNVIEPG